jgi:hypothetical protein
VPSSAAAAAAASASGGSSSFTPISVHRHTGRPLRRLPAYFLYLFVSLVGLSAGGVVCRAYVDRDIIRAHREQRQLQLQEKERQAAAASKTEIK